MNTPIIVGGCPRSGTSLVRRILDSHSRIHCGPEVKFLRDFYGDYKSDQLASLRFFASARSIMSEDELFGLFGKAFIELHQRAALVAGKERWADKTPENLLYLPQWQILLGDQWPLVHVIRNPIDTIASMIEARFVNLPDNLADQISLYLEYLERGEAFFEHNRGRYVRVEYELLATSPKAVVRDLMGRLGEEFEDAQLAFNRQRHQVGLEDRKIEETDGVNDRSLGAWRQHLSPAIGERIWRDCGPAWLAVTKSAWRPIGLD